VAESRRELTGRLYFGPRPLGWIGHIIWFLLAGWWQTFARLTTKAECFVSIIDIPFGIQHFKLVKIALAPIVMKLVPVQK
jgi:uncharacterized membrane protein YccF (DUF307 family)